MHKGLSVAVFVVLAIAALAVGCQTDPAESETPPAVCEPGALECEGQDVRVCIADGTDWTFVRRCAADEACAGGDCRSADGGQGGGEGEGEGGVQPGPLDGEIGGACYRNGTCDGSLVCEDSLCQAPPIGVLDGPCYRNGTCDDGLTCNEEDLCVVAAEGEGEAAGEGEGEGGVEGEGEGGDDGGGEGEGEGAGDGEGGEGEGGDDGQGEGEIEPPGCDEPCPGNQSCDEMAGVCLEPDDCERDLDCIGVRLCDEGECIDPCRDNADCPGARRCVQGLCPERDPCIGPADCDAGRACHDRACADRCDDDDACPGEQICDPRARVCVVPGGCDDDADCPGARSCEDGRCVEPERCFAPEDCNPGRICNAGHRCVTVCDGDNACPGNQSCDLDARRCVEPAECAGDVDCLPPRRCQAQLCSDPCNRDRDCPGQLRCDVAEGLCVERADCRVDDDCVGDRVCDAGGCHDADCAVAQDCVDAGQTCVDRRCVAIPAPGCDDDDDCVGRQGCSPAGVCTQLGPCEQADDCPAAAPHCIVGGGRCMGCRRNADCAAAEYCSAGTCAYVGDCAQDADCPGDRPCDEGACVAAECDPDRFDEADPPVLLERRTYLGLVLCDDQTDRYRVEVPAGEGVRVVLRHEDGDLALALVAAGGERADSDGPYGVEIAGLAADPEDRTVEVEVTGRAGASVDYSLTVQTPAPGWCPPDALEGVAGNDDAEHAVWVSTPALATVLCPDDEDWFAVYLGAGTRLTARATPDGGAGRATMTVRTPDGDEEAEAEGGQLVAEVAVATPTRVLISLSHAGGDDAVPVALTFAVEATDGCSDDDGDPEDCAACSTGLELTPGVPLQLPSALPVDRLDVGCASEEAALDAVDRVAWFDLAVPATVSVKVRGAREGMSLELRQGDCRDGTLAEDCALAAFEEDVVALEHLELAQGRWFVVVEGGDALQPELLLTASLQCDDDDDCDPGVCAGLRCQAACEEDEDCRGAQTCDAGRCVEPDPCADDRGCAGVRACEFGECFLPECRDHRDCVDDGEVCVDRRCVVGELACQDDPGCGPRLLCEPTDGRDVQGPCDDDDDCGGPTPVCFVEAGRCVGCLAEGQCEAAEICDLGRCVESGECEEDGDCRGSRTCEEGEGAAGGSCAPAACDGDRFDGLESPLALRSRTYTGLVLCDGQQDAYRLRVPPDRGATVVLTHPPDQGDLSLSITLAGELQAIARSDGPDGFEAIGVDDAAVGRELEVRVEGRPGVSVPYTLSIQRTEQRCSPDSLEGLPDNDGPDRATRVELQGYSATICACDEDWFDPEVPVGATLTASATSELVAPEALTLQIMGPDGPLADGQVEEGSKVVSATASDPGRFLVRVATGDGQTRAPVDLQFDAEAAEGSDTLACGDVAELVRGQPQRLPAHAPVVRFAMDCMEGGSPALALIGMDFVAHFTLDEAAEVTIRAPGALGVEIREQCPDGDFLWCDVPQPDGVAVEDFPLGPGDHWIVLQAPPGASPVVSVEY